MQSFKLLSWNVAGRVQCLDKQIGALDTISADIIALQEVTSGTLDGLREGLRRIGFDYVCDSSSVTNRTARTGARRYNEIIASRWSMRTMDPKKFGIPWRERVLSVIVNTPFGTVEIHTAHIPAGVSHGLKKIETLDGIFNRLARKSANPRILCGDFNTPQKETEDGQVVTWGQRITKKGKVVLSDQHWDRGERQILCELTHFDLPDVYRSINGYATQEYSWYWKAKGREIGRRFDHIFASVSLNPKECKYLPKFRQNGLSDHSPIVAIFEPRTDRKNT